MNKPGSAMGSTIRGIRLGLNDKAGPRKCPLSQRKLAKKAGVGENLVTLYESGALQPWKKLELVLNAMGYELGVFKR
jgi:transcriptional regulator with XRE-family HTH domain